MLSIDEINKLQADNKKLNDIIDSYQPVIQKYKDTLQAIKAIAEKEIYMKQNSSMDRILDLIAKAEEE